MSAISRITLLRRRIVLHRSNIVMACFVCWIASGGCDWQGAPDNQLASDAPREVVFWHFWGGEDRPIVEEIIANFNASQSRHVARAIAMPGNNLDLKFFLSFAGGDPPDLLNQDDPVVADWAHRGAIRPLAELASPAELAALESWLLPAARSIGTYQGRLFALCNGLDIRALYVNKTLLDELGVAVPQTVAELDELAVRVAPPDGRPRRRMGFLPDPRRIWAWGIVFGGRFWEPTAPSLAASVTADSPPVLRALEWMAGYRDLYGASELTAFRSGDQSLAGAAFPLLSDRRYAAIMDGQWRVRDIARAGERAGQDEFVVVPLPPPPSGNHRAGWVNGNFFLVPRGARNPEGAWELMKFWSGFDNHEAEAAAACAAGGWIPAAQAVINHPTFQHSLEQRPLMKVFVDLAASEHQVPTPPVPVAALYYDEVVAAAQDVLYRDADPRARLTTAANRVRSRLAEVLEDAR